jgi:trans-2,3-dihydro-3-hydroxyanthranilate isomerase
MSVNGLKKLTFCYVDAFTTTRCSGNPCAVIVDATKLTDKERQLLAFEFGLSETAFIEDVNGSTVVARYFTPAQELPFAGHPTLAVVHALFEYGVFSESVRQVTVSVPAGNYTVRITGKGADRRYALRQPRAQFLRTYERAHVAEVLSLTEEDLVSACVVQTVSTGTPQLMVPIVNQQTVYNAVPDIPKFTRLSSQGDFYGIHIFCVEERTAGEQVTYARHFCLPPDRTEDPFTGSATGGMAAYLWHYGLLKRPTFFAYQGELLNRPGEATVECEIDGDEVCAVTVTGAAVRSLVIAH